MKIKASGCSALILATGLFACFAAPLPATAASANSATTASKSDTAASADSTKQSSKHSKRDAHRKSGTDKSSETDTKKAADTGATNAGALPPSAIPASVANANAQLTADASGDSASAMSAKANTLLAGADKAADGQPGADGQVVSSD
jgi:hypothetical protein